MTLRAAGMSLYTGLVPSSFPLLEDPHVFLPTEKSRGKDGWGRGVIGLDLILSLRLAVSDILGC